MNSSRKRQLLLSAALTAAIIAGIAAGIIAAASLPVSEISRYSSVAFAAPDYDAGKPEGADFTVIFDSRGGSEVPKQYVKNGELLKEPEAPAKKNLEFEGWFTAPEDGTRWEFETPVKTNMTLYAHYCARVKARPYPEEGGLVYSGNIDYASVHEDNTWSEAPGSIGGYTALENNGYVFKEWRAGSVDGPAVTTDDTLAYYCSEDKMNVYFSLDDGGYEFFAIFERDPSYTGLLSIEVRTLPSKVKYTSGEPFDPAGIAVYANYGDNTSVDITNSEALIYAPEGPLFENNDEITLTFTDGGVTVKQKIDIVVGILPSELPDPTEKPTAPPIEPAATEGNANNTPANAKAKATGGDSDVSHKGGAVNGLLIAVIVLLSIVIIGGAVISVLFLRKKKDGGQ